MTYASVVTFKFGWTIFCRVLRADDSAVRAIEEALEIAEGSSDDLALGVVKLALGVALVYRDATADHRRGLELMRDVRDMWLLGREPLYGMPLMDLYVARESARSGDRDGAIAVMRKTVEDLQRAGRRGFGVFGAGVLVETLLDGGTEDEMTEAQTAIDRLAHLPADEDWAVSRDLAASATGAGCPRPRRRSGLPRLGEAISRRAKSLGFEGHIVMAEAMV